MARDAAATAEGGNDVAAEIDGSDDAAEEPPPTEEHYDFPSKFGYSQRDLLSFLRAIKNEFRPENPYHDAVQTLHCLLHMGGREATNADDLGVFGILGFW